MVSMRMAGIGMPRICLPVFAIALGLSGLSFWINASVAPNGEASMKQMLYRMATDNPMALFETGQAVNQFPGYVMWAEGKEGNVLTNFQVIQLDENRKPVQTIFAQRVTVNLSGINSLAEVSELSGNTEGGAGELVLEMEDVHMDMKDTADPENLIAIRHGVTLGSSTLSISLEEMRKKAKSISPSMMEIGALRAGLNEAILPKEELSEYRTELSKRVSLSLACVTFALIAIPLGVTAQRRETSIGFAFSLAVGMIYFLFIVVADSYKSEPSAYPHLLMLIPNVLFLSLGGWLFFRLSRR
jgi:lipopolysaccharide export system permease protein